eukprot:UN08804
MDYIFRGVNGVSHGIENWNTSSVISMREVFYDAKVYADVTKWNVESVENMNRMFYLSSSFNKRLRGVWDTRSVNDSALFNDKSDLSESNSPF